MNRIISLTKLLSNYNMGNFLSRKKDKDFMTDYTNKIKINGETIYYKALPNYDSINKDKSKLYKKLDLMEKHVKKLLFDKLFYNFLDTDHKYLLASILKDIQEMSQTSITKNKIELVINKISGIHEYIQDNKNIDDINYCDKNTSLLNKYT